MTDFVRIIIKLEGGHFNSLIVLPAANASLPCLFYLAMQTLPTPPCLAPAPAPIRLRPVSPRLPYTPRTQARKYGQVPCLNTLVAGGEGTEKEN